jgi:hypothetical protein
MFRILEVRLFWLSHDRKNERTSGLGGGLLVVGRLGGDVGLAGRRCCAAIVAFEQLLRVNLIKSFWPKLTDKIYFVQISVCNYGHQ